VEISTQIQLKFHGVDFPVINLNSETPFSKNEGNEISITIVPKVFFPEQEPTCFKIIQEVTLTSENYFNLFLLSIGTFEINENLDSSLKKTFVNVNAPAIMFPYIRAFISTLTTNIGNVTGTLTIPTQFFNGELEELKSLDD
jgi:preprotein translocase subunit SecB